MIRRSVSQIFQTNSPRENIEAQGRETEAQNLANMISHLQCSRPKISQPSPFPTSNPLHQQPAQPNSWVSQFTDSNLQPKPRNQIEAMPPSSTGSSMNVPANFKVPRVILDSAVRHPVFFTDRFKKVPHGIGYGKGSPVSEGYIFEEGERRGGESRL
ncbi:hypothetical protein HYALB_00002633 [Hymenoscyphus albidus]|uniref:Uncharacterized protein n=1 Tax=Hymenoscyphus albidus TaxID=595503 RepID=A0A9N9Q4W5_9HELO|nr:hypothetical protein HYALB_00002633 [Hymenoscyphus albidus]